MVGNLLHLLTNPSPLCFLGRLREDFTQQCGQADVALVSFFFEEVARGVVEFGRKPAKTCFVLVVQQATT